MFVADGQWQSLFAPQKCLARSWFAAQPSQGLGLCSGKAGALLVQSESVYDETWACC